jgi:hypothetical protein
MMEIIDRAFSRGLCGRSDGFMMVGGYVRRATRKPSVSRQVGIQRD